MGGSDLVAVGGSALAAVGSNVLAAAVVGDGDILVTADSGVLFRTDPAASCPPVRLPILGERDWLPVTQRGRGVCPDHRRRIVASQAWAPVAPFTALISKVSGVIEVTIQPSRKASRSSS
jgi:hypothetical protein